MAPEAALLPLFSSLLKCSLVGSKASRHIIITHFLFLLPATSICRELEAVQKENRELKKKYFNLKVRSLVETIIFSLIWFLVTLCWQQ